MSEEKPRDAVLWILVLAGPVLWLCSFEAKFALLPWACTFGQKLALYLVSAAAFALIGVSALSAWRVWQQLGSAVPEDAEGALPRSRLMALGGLVFSIGFCLVTLAQAIPDAMLAACE